MPKIGEGDNAVSLIEELQETQPFIWIYCFAFMAIAAYVILNLVTATICSWTKVSSVWCQSPVFMRPNEVTRRRLS